MFPTRSIPTTCLTALALIALSLLDARTDAAIASEPALRISEAQTQSITLTKPVFKAETVLTDLRDTRLALTQVKQQSVNLFMEASRTSVIASDPPLEHTPHELSANMFDPAKKYLPPRKEWLVFYVNTLEPIVHLLTEEMKDTEKNGFKMPAAISEDEITPSWNQWTEDLKSINKSVDELQELIAPDSGTNEALANTALAIYDRASHMEKLRFEVALIFRKELIRAENSAMPDKHGSP